MTTVSEDNNNELPRPVPTGNDMSEGDARDESREDKDEDLKMGDDDGSPLAKPFKEKQKRINPDGLLEGGNVHNKHNMAEHDEPDPSNNDDDSLSVDSQYADS